MQTVKAMGLERVVAKRRDSAYRPGRALPGLGEAEAENQQEFVVGGYRSDGENSIDALLVGYYDGRKVKFAGKVRAGLVAHARRDLATPAAAASHRGVPVRRPAQRQIALGCWRHR